MPALMYDDEGVDLSLGARVRTNRDKESLSVYFTKKRKQKVQFGSLSEPGFRVLKMVEDEKTGKQGVHLEVFSKDLKRWWKNFEVDLLFDVKRKRKEWGLVPMETHDLQAAFSSSFVGKGVLELRIADDCTYFCLDDDGDDYDEVDDETMEVGSLVLPIVQFVGLWMKDDGRFGVVAEVCDMMLYDDDEDDDEEDAEEVEQRKRKRQYVDSPVESVCGYSVAEQSLHPNMFQ
jgi:hypothetical protein